MSAEVMAGKRPVAQIDRLESLIETSQVALTQKHPRLLSIPVFNQAGKVVSTKRSPVSEQFIFGMKCVLKSDELQNPYGQAVETTEIIPPSFFKKEPGQHQRDKGDEV